MENLGFAETPRATRIFINRIGDILWYTWDGKNEKPIPIEAEGINCVLLGLSVNEAKSDFGDSLKLDISIQADKLYDLRVGVSTCFAKDLVMTLDSATDEQLNGVLHISPKPSQDNKKVLFCTILSNKKLVQSKHKWKGEDGQDIPFDLQAAIDRINFRLNSFDRGSSNVPEEIEHNLQDPAAKNIIPC